MRVLVTGATGFAGRHLVDLLLEAQNQVFVLLRSRSSLESLPDHPLIFPIEGDLLDRNDIAESINQSKPDVIYHLAGQAYPSISWQNPAFTIQVNTGGTANLLEAAAAYGRPKVVVVTSADMYGQVSESDLPLTEASPPHPRHPYGVSKWAAAELVRLYWERYQLPVSEARPFNHIGPRQALGFVVPDFASQIAAIKLGQTDAAIQVGNLDAQRDFCDVRDVVQAYKSIADNGLPGESYLICTGRPVPIYRLVDILADIAQVKPDIAYDPARMRPSDVPVLFGSAAKLQKQTGWQPKISLDESLQDVLAEWLIQLTQPKEIE